jgi:hypothetical protein
MNYGFNGCPVNFGAVQQNTTAAQMGNLADAANAGGFAFNSYLSYGVVMIGLYPAGCQSSANLSWPLYLKANSLPQFMQPQTQSNWCWAANGDRSAIFTGVREPIPNAGSPIRAKARPPAVRTPGDATNMDIWTKP